MPRVEASRAAGRGTASETEAVTRALGAHAHHHSAQGERIGALAAVRILVVHEAVTVVVLAVAADLGDLPRGLAAGATRTAVAVVTATGRAATRDAAAGGAAARRAAAGRAATRGAAAGLL